MHKLTANRRATRPLLLTLAALGVVACNSSTTPSGGANNVGSVQENPDTGSFFIVDANDAGLAPEPRFSRVSWGRTVDVYGLDSENAKVLMQSDFVIDPNLGTDGTDFILEANPVTTAQQLTILRNVEDTTKNGGRDQFFSLLKLSEQNLQPVFDKSFNGSGFFTMVPRNATVVIQATDLIDPATLDTTTVQTFVGNPSVIPFEPRVIVDPNHGDLANFDGIGGPEFYSTRLLIDMTVSEIESFEADPPLPVNNLGLPASVDTNLANVRIEIPTKTDPTIGQELLLRNPTEHAFTTNNNGNVDYSKSTLPIVRVARSGGDTNVTNDPYNGFLKDEVAPSIIGQIAAALVQAPVSLNPPPLGDGTEYLLPVLQYASVFCAETPRVGDILEQPGIFAQVTQVPAPEDNGVVQNMRVKLLAWPPAWDEAGQNGPLEWETTGIGPIQILTPFDPILDNARAGCFIKFAPNPTGLPGDPTTGVFPSSVASIRFSEPMDAGDMSSVESIRIKTTPNEEPLAYEYVIGTIQPAVDLLEFNFAPDLPFSHVVGNSETYFYELGTGVLGPIDLAGNALATELPTIPFSLEASAIGKLTGGRVSRFTSADEEPPFPDPGDDQFDPIPEWAGQHTYDLERQSIRPRSVTRFEGIVDRSQQLVGVMGANALGAQSPLSIYGSKTQILWRHEDLGLALRDSVFYNLDVEGLNWAPLGGQAVVDNYDLFEIAISHGSRYPDELLVNFPPPLPFYQNSGMLNLFNQNQLSPITDPQQVVHDRNLGYSVNPGEIFLSSTNTKLLPFPLNRTVAPDKKEYWTWRDTAVYERAAEDGFGIPSAQWHVVTGVAFPPLTADCNGNCPADMMYTAPVFNPFYDPGQVQSIALPMLLEFRCWPDDGAVGINRFDTSIVTNTSTQPYFRAFSTGGIDTNLEKVFVDPDLETVANGGFNPSSFPNPGEKTFGQDNQYYIGAVDFVVRVSRSYSVWMRVLENDGSAFLGPKFYDPITEPRPDDQPLGTSIGIAVRGAVSVQGNGDEYEDIRDNALRLDAYGDHYPDTTDPCGPDNCGPFGCGSGTDNHNQFDRCTGLNQVNIPVSFLNLDDSWFEDTSEIDGAGYYQVRLTFTSNSETGLSPELSTFAMSWSD